MVTYYLLTHSITHAHIKDRAHCITHAHTNVYHLIYAFLDLSLSATADDFSN